MKRRCRGVSLLLEALLGIGIFGCAVLVVFGLFPTTHRSITQARHYAEALSLAREASETEQARGFPQDSDGDGNPDPVPYAETLVPIEATVDGRATETIYNVTVSSAFLDPTLPADRRMHILVRVLWTEGPISRQVEAETVVTQRANT